MPKLIAIEWDDQLARVMVARVGSGRVQVDRVLEVGLDGASGLAQGTPAEALAARLQEAKIGKGEAIVNVGRSGTELRMLEVPRVPEEELPPIVRFQALRQFAAMTDDWKLDFIKQPVAETSEHLRVLAAAISPQLFKQIEAGCEASGLRPTRMLFRPFTLATMFNALLPSEGTRLCLDTIGDEADLLVLRGDEIDLVRTTRLARNEAGEINTKQLVSELRRTLMAYRSQPDSEEVTQCVICGGESELALAEQLANELKIETTVFDPFEMVDISAEAAASLGSSRRRFAGLIGAVLDTAEVSDNRIDFLNPRKPPVDDGNRRRNSTIAALVAAAVLLLIGAGWMHNYLLSAKVKRLSLQVNNMRESHKRVIQEVEDVKKLDEFAKTADLNWLEEISYVSRELPRDEVIVDGLSGVMATKTVGKAKETEGVIQLNGRAKNYSTMQKVEKRLWDERHDVLPGSRSQEITDAREYRWGFSERVTFGVGGEKTDKNASEAEATNADDGESPAKSESESSRTAESTSVTPSATIEDETGDREAVLNELEVDESEDDPADVDVESTDLESPDKVDGKPTGDASGEDSVEDLKKLLEESERKKTSERSASGERA